MLPVVPFLIILYSFQTIGKETYSSNPDLKSYNYTLITRSKNKRVYSFEKYSLYSKLEF